MDNLMQIFIKQKQNILVTSMIPIISDMILPRSIGH